MPVVHSARAIPLRVTGEWGAATREGSLALRAAPTPEFLCSSAGRVRPMRPTAGSGPDSQRPLPLGSVVLAPLTIPAADLPILEAVARRRRLCWFQVQHARIVLAVAGGERVHDVASRLECDRATVATAGPAGTVPAFDASLDARGRSRFCRPLRMAGRRGGAGPASLAGCR
jgi:hypothetical protein